MSSIASAKLSEGERTLLERYVDALASVLGVELLAVWLFGSRARGEDNGEESDVDVLVLVDDASWERRERMRELLHRTAHALALDDVAWSFSVHIHTPAWLHQRREIGSFFISEVDRDKVVVAGRT